MVKLFPFDLGDKTVKTPSTDIFKKDNSKRLDKTTSEIFHTFVAKGLFLSKRACLDIHPTIAGMCTRVRDPNEGDWNGLIRLLRYLKSTMKMVLTLSSDKSNIIKWHSDASFAVHPDFKSHSSSTMSMGKGAVQCLKSRR